MDSALYVDELINEYLLFRGFIKTFTHFNTEKSTSAAAYAERSGGGGGGGDRDRAAVGGGSGGGGDGGGAAGGGGAGASGSIGLGGGASSPHGSSASVAANVPTNVDALVDLVVGHVRAAELDQFNEVWAQMHSRFFVHLEGAQARALPAPSLSVGAGVNAAAAPGLHAAGLGSLGTGLALGSSSGAASMAPLPHALRSLEQSLKKALLVRAVQRGRMDRLEECLAKLAPEMTAGAAPWGWNAGGGVGGGMGGGGMGGGGLGENGSDFRSVGIGGGAGGMGGNGFGLPGSSAASAAGGASIITSPGNGWEGWFSLGYVTSPELHPLFAPYFSARWWAALVASLRNLLTAAFRALPLPTLLAFNIERERRRKTNSELRSLRAELERTRSDRDQAQTQLARLKNQGYRVFQRGSVVGQTPGASPAHPTHGSRAVTTGGIPQTPQAQTQGSLLAQNGAFFSPMSAAPTPAAFMAAGSRAPGAGGVGASAAITALALMSPPPGPGASGVSMALMPPPSFPPVAAPAPVSSTSSSAAVPFAASSLAALEGPDSCGEGPLAVQEIHTLLGHSGPVLRARFNNEGSALVTASNDDMANDESGPPSSSTTTASHSHSHSLERERERGGALSRPAAAAATATSRLWNIQELVESSRRAHQRAVEQAEESSRSSSLRRASHNASRKQGAAEGEEEESDSDGDDSSLPCSSSLSFAPDPLMGEQAQRRLHQEKEKERERSRRRMERRGDDDVAAEDDGSVSGVTVPSSLSATPAAPSRRVAPALLVRASSEQALLSPQAVLQQGRQYSTPAFIQPASQSRSHRSGAGGSFVGAEGDEEDEEEEEEDASALRPYCTLSHSSALSCLTFSQSDAYLLTGAADGGRVCVWNVAASSSSTYQRGAAGRSGSSTSNRRPLAEFVSPDAMPSSSAAAASTAAAAAPSCPVVLDVVSSPGDRFLVACWGERPALRGASEPWHPSAARAGRGCMEAWDLESGRRDTVFQLQRGGGGGAGGVGGPDECTQINSLALNHNGNMLVSGGADGMIRVWDTRSPAAMVGWSAHSGAFIGGADSVAVGSIKLCADETTVLSAGLDGTVVEWSLHRIGKMMSRFAMPLLPQPQQRAAAPKSPPVPVRKASASSRSRAGSRARTLSTSSASSSLLPESLYAAPELALDGETHHFLLSPGFGWGGADDAEADAFPTYLFGMPSQSASADASAIFGSAASNAAADVATLPPVQRLFGHAGPVLSVDWHPAATMLVTASVDHTARLMCGVMRPTRL